MNAHVQSIKRAVAARFGLTVSDLDSRIKTEHFVWPRQVAMYLVFHNAKISYTDIARLFGGRNHTSVSHNIKKVSEALVKSPSLLSTFEEIIVVATNELNHSLNRSAEVLGELIATRVHTKMEAIKENPKLGSWPPIEPEISRFVLEYYTEFPADLEDAANKALRAFKSFESAQQSRNEAAALNDLTKTMNNLNYICERIKK